jgi:FecR-like protein
MLNKILSVIVLGLVVGLSPANAQPAPSAPARVKGQIQAARVLGHVEAISKVDGVTRVLHDGDKVSEQTTIRTLPGASIILVFSNGATVNVGADSSLDIDQFDQDPFAADVKVSELTQEPSTSTTKLNLTRGELVGKVVHLNVDRGSEFTVQTPVGAAGIRGTTFRIIFRPDPKTGKAFFEVTTADGRVLFTGITTGPVSIPSGKQVVSTFNYSPPTSPGGTGTATNVTISGLTDIPLAEAEQISDQTQQIVAATNPVVFTSSGSGAGGGTPPPPNPNSLPSNPVQPAPAITPGAGSP